MIIYGAGLAGLLSAHMLRRYSPVIHEAQPSLPNNHEALLRFRTDAVARATGIPFKKVEVSKSIIYKGRTLGHADIQTNNLYSYKVTGEYHPRSISDLRTAERYIAPPNFIAQMARSVTIEYGKGLQAHNLTEWVGDANETPVISTVPMPVLMQITGWDKSTPIPFNFKAIYSVWVEIQSPRCDVYQTIYYPDPELPYYRVSITGNKLIMEMTRPCPGDEIDRYIGQICRDFGLFKVRLGPVQTKEQKYGKILPIDDAQRRRFILAMTDEYKIYSVGRFATWKQILLDDVVQDIGVVEKLISLRGEGYGRALVSLPK